MLDPQIVEIFSHAGQVPQPDPRAPSDPVMTEMVRLQSLPERERGEALEPYFESWLETGKDRLAVARYLAAAGLTLEQAVRLEDLVLSRAKEVVRKQARKEIVAGLALMATGVAFGVFSIVAQSRFPGWGLVLFACFVAGGTAFYRGVRLMRRISAMPQDEIDR